MSAKDPYTREEDSRFTLRLPTTLLEEIKEIAQKEKRSVGKQIVYMLEQWLEKHPKA